MYTHRIDVKVSITDANKLLSEKFPHLHLHGNMNLRYTEFLETYGNTSGPFGGIGGNAMTQFILSAWYDPEWRCAVVFCEDKIIAVVGSCGFNIGGHWKKEE